MEFHGTSHEAQDTEDHFIYFLNFPHIVNTNLVIQQTYDFNMILATLDAMLTFY